MRHDPRRLIRWGPFAGLHEGPPAEIIDPRHNPRDVERRKLRAKAHRELGSDHVCDERCGDTT